MNSLNLHVNLSFQQLVDVVKQLSPAEKLKLNDVIWSEDTAIPLVHQQLVQERMDKVKANPELLEDWESASARLEL